MNRVGFASFSILPMLRFSRSILWPIGFTVKLFSALRLPGTEWTLSGSTLVLKSNQTPRCLRYRRILDEKSAKLLRPNSIPELVQLEKPAVSNLDAVMLPSWLHP